MLFRSKLYEDNALGTISQDRYEQMSQKYSEEYYALKAELATLQEQLSAYVPYKIGKLQIQGFSEPTTPNKIKQSYHITQKAARSRPRAAFLRGKLGRRQDFSKK